MSSQEKNSHVILFTLRIARELYTPGRLDGCANQGLGTSLAVNSSPLDEGAVISVCVNDLWPQMKGAGLSSVIKHLLKAHWMPGTE